jgi:hypothetical protein
MRIAAIAFALLFAAAWFPAIRAETTDPAAPGKVRDLTFDDLKFEMKKEDPFFRSLLTPKIEQLSGTKIRIRGFILPTFQQKGIMRFVLVRDNMECCFGPGAALYDAIVVDMVPGQSATFSTRPVTVEGTFTIRELKTPDKKGHLAIYHLAGESVK